jgi:CheY-like chemotaxis protein
VNSPEIAVVDDDDTMRYLILAIAREAMPSAHITEHTSSTYALQQIDAGAADLLITNCHMPDMDGPTLVRTNRTKRNAIPIIMVSSSDDARLLGESAGIDRFVAKDVIVSELPHAIQDLLNAA